MSTDPWGGGTDQDPKLRRRERKDLFNPYSVNPDRLPGEPFERRDDREWPGASKRAGTRWTVRDWIFLAAVLVVVLQAVRYYTGH